MRRQRRLLTGLPLLREWLFPATLKAGIGTMQVMDKPNLVSFLLGLSAVAAALDSAAQDRAPQLEEMIVTAEKRSESLQDLSQAVTALSGEDVDNRNVITFVDLGSIAPGVTAAKNEGYKTVIAIRGVGNEANQNAIANPSVSYHLDGIYVASPFALHTDFLDLERIEVLRGPQGTLFGQNSTGGAINVITKAPDTEEFFGKADITVGNYSLVRARGSVNIPISDTVALRASAASHNHDGFSRNITLDQELDQADSFSGRARLLWAPAENLRFNFTAQYYDENTNGAAQKGIFDSTPDPRRLTQDWHSSYELESQLYSLVAEWDLPAFTVRSLTSYQDDDVTVVRDNDRHDFSTLVNRGTFLLPAGVDPETDRQKTFTQELNLISTEPLFGRLDWTAGVFYLDTEVDILFREYIDFNTDGVYGPDTVTVEEVLNFGGEVGSSPIPHRSGNRSPCTARAPGTLPTPCAWSPACAIRKTRSIPKSPTSSGAPAPPCLKPGAKNSPAAASSNST